MPFQFNQSFNTPFNARLPPPKKFVSSNSVNITNGYHSYANNDFLLLDKPLLNAGLYSGAIAHNQGNLADPRRSSFSCFLSSNGFPGYSTIEKKHYYSSSKLNNDIFSNNKSQPTTDLLTPTVNNVKCYQQLFANSVKFEQQLSTLNANPISYVSNNKFQSPAHYSHLHMTKTNPVYLTNEHFLPNSRKSVAVSEIAFTGNEKEAEKFKLDKRKSLCENISLQTRESFENNYKQFRHLNQQQQQKLMKKSSSNHHLDSIENSLEYPLLDQLNSLASDNGDYQSLIAKNLIKTSPNSGKFKCSRLANVGLLSNVASLAQTGARVTPQSKMSRLLCNRKLDLKQSANKQKQRRSFSGEINCELLNSLDSVDEDQSDWPELIEEQEISKSDTERDGCETVWNYSIKNQEVARKSSRSINNLNDKKEFTKAKKIDDLSLKRPKLIVDDQLNLVDIENAIRNSTNLLNLSVFNVASDEEDQDNQNIKLELLRNKNKDLKNKKRQDDENSIDDFELANDDFEFHTTKSINSNKSENSSTAREISKSQLNTDSKINDKQLKSNQQINSNSFKEIKKQDSTKVNGLFKKNSKSGQNDKLNVNKIESDYRRKSITSITPLSSNQNRPLLNSKQSKSVSDLTAQFENCIKNNPNQSNRKDELDLANKRSTSESNLAFEKDAINNQHSNNVLPASTALMLQLIKQSNHNSNSHDKYDSQSSAIKESKAKATNSNTITRKKFTETRKTPSISSSNCSDELVSRRYLKKDEQKVNKKEIKPPSMLPVSAINGNKKESRSRGVQQPPHFRFIRLSDLPTTNLTRNQVTNEHLIASNKLSPSKAPIKFQQHLNHLNSSSNTPIMRKYQQQVYQPVYRSNNSNLAGKQSIANGQLPSNRVYQSPNLSSAAPKHTHCLANGKTKIELHRSNSTNSLVPQGLLTSVNSMPNLAQSNSNLFPFNFQ